MALSVSLRRGLLRGPSPLQPNGRRVSPLHCAVVASNTAALRRPQFALLGINSAAGSRQSARRHCVFVGREREQGQMRLGSIGQSGLCEERRRHGSCCSATRAIDHVRGALAVVGPSSRHDQLALTRCHGGRGCAAGAREKCPLRPEA